MLPLFLLTIARFLHFGLSFWLHRARMISILSISTFLYNIQEGKTGNRCYKAKFLSSYYGI